MTEEIDQDLAAFGMMTRIRAFEEVVRDLRIAGEIVGSVHLAIGQECGPAVLAPLLAPDDALFATYRGHGWGLACGVPAQALFAELLGRGTGVNGGRGGSAYFTSPRHRFFGENSIVGAGAPIAVGAALAGAYDGSGRVAVSVLGDGALNQGSVHEAMNFAAARRLPVVFYCENNGWSEMTPIREAVGDDRLFRRAAAYGMRGERVDGNDASELRARITETFALARSGGGPTLLEAMTTRLAGHYIGDVEQYRGEEDRLAAQANDPIIRLHEVLGRRGVVEDRLAEIERSERQEIEAAALSARAAPLADPALAREHLYA